jgi:hypothetical protein
MTIGRFPQGGSFATAGASTTLEEAASRAASLLRLHVSGGGEGDEHPR